MTDQTEKSGAEITPAVARRNEAGSKNLERWRRENPRQNNRHGVFAALLGAEPHDLHDKLESFETDIIRDLGGPNEITAARRALIASCRVSYAVVLLGQALLERSHISAKRRKSLAGVLECLVSNQNSLRRDLTVLGLERSETPPQSLADAIAEFQKEKTDAAHADDH